MPEPRNSETWNFQERRSGGAPPSGVVPSYARRAGDRPARSPFLSNPGCSIEGVKINLPSLRAAHAEAVDRASRGQGFSLFTMNLDHLAKIRSDRRFHAAYQRATLVSADGWPVVWLANRKGGKLERACGSDLVEPVCESAAAHGIPLFFIGPGQKSQARALAVLEERYPSLRVAGAWSPNISKVPSHKEIENVARRVNASGARLCFVSLGAPKQELLVDALTPLCEGVGFLCVGAALDFISGQSRRAPGWLQHAGLEWLWRLIGDPKRLAIRYLLSVYVFLLLMLGLEAGNAARFI
jgi:exopolysaccharide biosynthesis WecB/TagA/CpsF family protein